MQSKIMIFDYSMNSKINQQILSADAHIHRWGEQSRKDVPLLPVGIAALVGQKVDFASRIFR
ncbi:hypothetical protein CEE39_06835 [bacterium (candidate division B38) B3_B38]|nr:MAG: hypothetical protein CEE39_06835 [bacterium (candidate division B38) B3_B38]